MTTKLGSISFHAGGYCRQLARLTGMRSWTFPRFHAVFVYFEHPEHGPNLIDTGYSRHFWHATRRFPQRFLRWLLPVRLHAEQDPPQILRSAGIDPEKISRIFVSHWHADHIGGLKCFPQSEFVYRRLSYEGLTDQSRVSQVQHGFLCDLIPSDFEARSSIVSEEQFVAGTGELDGFKTLDYWGDGSLQLVDLPGHANGHSGFVLSSEQQRFFYVADAYWHQDVLLAGHALPWPGRQIQDDYATYQNTQAKLKRLASETDWQLIACHCPKALQHVQGSSC